MMNYTKLPDLDVVWYDLSSFKPLLEPLCLELASPIGEAYTLGPDRETGKLNLWEQERADVQLLSALIDSATLEYLDSVHPKYKGKGKNYVLHKDGWLTTPRTRQHVVFHNHQPPFIQPEDTGEVVSVFYVQLNENIGPGNGLLEIYNSKNDSKPTFFFIPQQYILLLMTTEQWHKAQPFKGERYSLSTDIKVLSV